MRRSVRSSSTEASSSAVTPSSQELALRRRLLSSPPSSTLLVSCIELGCIASTAFLRPSENATQSRGHQSPPQRPRTYWLPDSGCLRSRHYGKNKKAIFSGSIKPDCSIRCKPHEVYKVINCCCTQANRIHFAPNPLKKEWYTSNSLK